MTVTADDRVKLIFSLFDADENGYLEEGDFSTMAGRVVSAAEASGDAAKQAMKAAFQRYWTTLERELDADSDGRVSLDEFVACVLSPDKFHETIAEFARALAALGDPDGDGLIERSEFVALMMAIGFERPNIHALFDAFVPSAEDRVRVPVWASGIMDYYSPDADDIAGDHLVR